jgi:hypothetical protein
MTHVKYGVNVLQKQVTDHPEALCYKSPSSRHMSKNKVTGLPPVASPVIPPTQSGEPELAGPRLKIDGEISKDRPPNVSETVGTESQGTL